MTQPSSRPSKLRAWLSDASRSRRFLWRLAIGILLAGCVAGYIGSRFQPTGPWHLGQRVAAVSGARLDDPDDDESAFPTDADQGGSDEVSAQVAEALARELQDPGVTFRDLLHAIPRIARLVRPAQRESMRALFAKRFAPDEASLLFNFLLAIGTTDRAATDQLRAFAERNPAMPFARYALGKVEMKQRHYQDAFAWFHREGQNPAADESRFLAVQALIKAKEYARLEEISRDENYRRYITPYVALEMAIGRRDWPQILRRSPALQIELFEGRVLAMTILVGIAWAFFLLHLAEAPRPTSRMAILCVLGLGLGVLSTVPTVYSVILQDDILQFSPRGDVARTILYYVGGVGVREELCKLLLFVPLLTVLIRRGDEFEALMVASFVGLGFAIEENGAYYLTSEFSSATGRFLTANFFHAALTGLNGLALYRACSQGARGLNDFCAIVPLTIVAHGLYDAGLNLPRIDDTGTISMVIFVFASWFYFSRVNELRNNVKTTISLTGAYVLSISIVSAAMISFQVMNLGPAAGARIAATELLGSAVLVFMFLREFREPLTQ